MSFALVAAMLLVVSMVIGDSASADSGPGSHEHSGPGGQASLRLHRGTDEGVRETEESQVGSR